MNKRKVFMPIVWSIVAVCIIFFGMLLTVESRVVGTWQREVMYLEKYGCDAVMVIDFNKDGTFSQVLYKADSKKILNTKEGYWKVSWFEVVAKEPGQSGSTPYDFNPITGTLKNNKLYHKLSR